MHLLQKSVEHYSFYEVQQKTYRILHHSSTAMPISDHPPEQLLWIFEKIRHRVSKDYSDRRGIAATSHVSSVIDFGEDASCDVAYSLIGASDDDQLCFE